MTARGRVKEARQVTSQLFSPSSSHELQMSGVYLSAISENASRLGMRLQESFSEHTRDLTVARGSGAYFEAPDDKTKNIRKQLDSSSDREKLDAMKRLVAVSAIQLQWCL